MKRLVPVLLILVFLTSCAGIQREAGQVTDGGNPRSIILLIGDGMGVAQLTAAKITGGELNCERLPVGGLATTHAENALVTDSAASGTAIATGHKTVNGAISVSSSGRPFKTVIEYAEEHGMATGLVATCSITHATPAVFAAHIDHRDKERGIAEQLARSDVDVMFGGGWAYFVPNTEPEGLREDGVNFLDVLRERMPVALSPEEFRDIGEVDAAAGLFYPGHPDIADRREPPLAELTAKAIEILSRDPDGFFLMVEGSQIDWAGHENSHEWLIMELLDFDEAVGVALDFAEHDGETLVVVTADHETGAYAVAGGSMEDGIVTDPRFGSGNHTASMVPILAYGPGCVAFGGMHDNTFIGETMIVYVTSSR